MPFSAHRVSAPDNNRSIIGSVLRRDLEETPTSPILLAFWCQRLSGTRCRLAATHCLDRVPVAAVATRCGRRKRAESSRAAPKPHIRPHAFSHQLRRTLRIFAAWARPPPQAPSSAANVGVAVLDRDIRKRIPVPAVGLLRNRLCKQALAAGTSTRWRLACAPALSPPIVTLFGSPPNNRDVLAQPSAATSRDRAGTWLSRC